MLERSLPLIILLAGCGQAVTTEPDPVVDPLVARLDSFMLQATALGFNGSVLVMKDGAPMLDKGYGLRDREKNLPNTPNTVHAIGSITKQFTAACILKLQEQGRLNVKDSLSRHLAGVPADKAGITLHHLLTHTAGFPGALGDDNEAIDGDDYFRLAMSTPLAAPPGERYEYSNVGYSLLGIVVERLSGRSLEDQLREELLLPAGLHHTGYRRFDPARDELAIGYRKDSTRWGTMLDHATVNGGPGWHLRGNGGMLSTTHDMAAWIDALRTNKVLGKAGTDAMFTAHVPEGGGSHYGYGWALFRTPRGTRLITHNGGNGVQFADVLWYADEGVTVVLMSNASPRGMQDLAWELGRTIVVPGHVPRLPEAPQPMTGLPEGAAGDRLRALSEVIAATSDDDGLKAWFNDHFGPGFLSDVPMEEHLAAFRRLRSDIGENRIEGVERLGPEEFAVRLVSLKSGKAFRVMVQLRPSDARISGLGVEAL